MTLWANVIAVKVKGTKQGLQDAAEFFLLNPHLQAYVRHIEVWVPVWGNNAVTPRYTQPADDQNRAVISTGVGSHEESANGNLVYPLASHNATMEDIFGCVQSVFPEAVILTIEGGHCRNPPMIQYFRNPASWDASFRRLPLLANIRTFVMRGAWNIIREARDYRHLSEALPNVREWHCAYAKPKAEGYTTISQILTSISNNLTHVNLCLEGFYDKSSLATSYASTLLTTHICEDLGRIAPRLEALSYTGKVCGQFFVTAAKSVALSQQRSKLKSLDFVVKNCCRPKNTLADGTGITNWAFIQHFELLVSCAVRNLASFPLLDYIRIRFIDLDSQCPLLNPYFQLKDGKCSGIWNERILSLLPEVRPGVDYIELGDGIEVCRQSDPQGRIIEAVYPRQRPLAIKVSSYKAIADLGKV